MTTTHIETNEKPVQLGRFVQHDELEIDKLFRAVVKFEGERPALEGWQCPRSSA